MSIGIPVSPQVGYTPAIVGGSRITGAGVIEPATVPSGTMLSRDTMNGAEAVPLADGWTGRVRWSSVSLTRCQGTWVLPTTTSVIQVKPLPPTTTGVPPAAADGVTEVPVGVMPQPT